MGRKPPKTLIYRDGAFDRFEPFLHCALHTLVQLVLQGSNASLGSIFLGLELADGVRDVVLWEGGREGGRERRGEGR